MPCDNHRRLEIAVRPPALGSESIAPADTIVLADGRRAAQAIQRYL